MEEKASICCYTPFDKEFPQSLRDYSQMPEVLYVKGRLPNPEAEECGYCRSQSLQPLRGFLGV